MAVFTTEDQNVAGESGPIDDGYITNAVGSLPGDPYCCTGPEPEFGTDDGRPAYYLLQHASAGHSMWSICRGMIYTQIISQSCFEIPVLNILRGLCLEA